MENKPSNRSLFLYTALIFAAAIIVIALSFFSQINADRTHSEYIEGTIAERTAMLSEENRILLETTNSLNQKIKEITEDNELLTDEVLQLDKINKNYEIMYAVHEKIGDRKFPEAVEMFQTLEPLFFTEAQDKFYEYLKEELDGYLPKEEAVE